MAFSLDLVVLPGDERTIDFLAALLGGDATAARRPTGIALGSGARIAVHDGPAAGGASVARALFTYIVEQPSEVEAIANAASGAGGEVLKRPKKGLFGGYSAVVRASGGSLWKPSSATRKDTGPTSDPPTPSETGVLLGVADPKASREFYAALGMMVDRDYGGKYADFAAEGAAWRLGLLPAAALAKDAGVGETRAGSTGVGLVHRAANADTARSLLDRAVAAGATPIGPGQEDPVVGEGDRGAPARFADPDGFVWSVLS